MTTPIKKRIIEMPHEDDSSTPTFDSPGGDDEEFRPIDESEIVGKTLQVPIFDSQDSQGGSATGLATQPTASTKKRKVSSSPQDSLARNPKRRNSPRKGNVEESVEINDTPLRSMDDSKPPLEPILPQASKNTPGEVKRSTPPKDIAATTTEKGRNSRKKNLSKADASEIENSITVEKPDVNSKDENSAKSKKTAKRSEKVSPVVPSIEESTTKTESPQNSEPHVDAKIIDANESKNQSMSSQMSDSTEAKSKKKKKRSFQDQLLELLFMSCKPYTVKVLAQQLHTTDSSVEFCLLSLVDKGWVFKKEFASKSRAKELYWANQEAKSKELMDSLNMVPPHEIRQAQEELQTLQKEHALLINELAGISKAPSNAELNIQLQEMQKDVDEFAQKLEDTHARIRSDQPESERPTKGSSLGTNRKQSNKPKSSQQLKKRINEMRLEWKNRKEKCMDFIEQLADGMEKKVKDVINLLELETDEMVGVRIPPKYDV